MADSMVAGLFGLTPEMYQNQQYQQDLATGYKLAQLSPGAAAQAGLRASVGQLGRGIAGAMGVEDPQMKIISARQQILGGLDQTNPASMLEGAKMLAQMGDQQGAFALADLARKAQSEVALAQQRTAEKMTPQERNAAAYARSVAEPGTPQYNRIYQTTLQSLISQEKPDLLTPAQKNAKAFALRAGPEGSPAFNEAYIAKLEQFTTKPESRPVLKEIGVAKGGDEEAVYTYQVGNALPQQVIFKNVNGQQTMIPYSGGVDRTTARTDVGVKLPEGESEFIKQLAKEDAQELSKARIASKSAGEELKSLQKLQQLNQQQLVSGSFATNRVGVLNFLNTLGMTSGKDAKTLANSEQYSKVTGDLLLDKIKKLGTQPSSTDREFIAKILPQLENSPAARQELINYLANRANEVVSEVRAMDTYARKNRGLGGYMPNIPLVGQTPDVSTMSTEQLQRIARGQKP